MGRSLIVAFLTTIVIANLIIFFAVPEEEKQLVHSAAFFHFFLYYLLPIYLLKSVNSEGKQMHHWLHNPQPACLLLLSKLLNSFFALILTLLISACFPFYLFSKQAGLHTFEGFLQAAFNHEPLQIGFGLLTSLGLTMFILFLWSLYHSMKPRLGKWSWLFLIAISLLTPLLGTRMLLGLIRLDIIGPQIVENLLFSRYAAKSLESAFLPLILLAD